MKLITLTRVRKEPDLTIGHLHLSKKETYATLEDPVRDEKIAGVTAIPAGVYELKLRNQGSMTKRYMKKFPEMHKGMIWLQNVPNFTYVYIHIGNIPEDTDGCILVGSSAGQSGIRRSTEAYKSIYPKVVKMIQEEGCFIYIKDERYEGYDNG